MMNRLVHFSALTGLLLALISSACSDDTVTPKPEPTFAWAEVSDVPTPVTLYGLWAPGADVVVGVGRNGQIWEWDGNSWAQFENPHTDDLFAIAGRIPGSVVAVGGHGTALRLSAGLPVKQETFTTNSLRGLWQSASGDFVAVGEKGVILNGTGDAWSIDSTITDTSLFSVWGAGDDDIFAVGAGGLILHFNGSTWNEMQSGTTAVLAAVNGTSGDDVYAVGAEGTLLHYDGVAWTALTSPTTEFLHSVCADCGPTAAGAGGALLRRVNGTWTHETTPGAQRLHAVAQTGNRLWAVGEHALLMHDGSAWTNQQRGTIPAFMDLASSSEAGIVAVGDNGVAMLGGPAQWYFEPGRMRQRLNAVWESPSGEIFAAGINGIFRLGTGAWVTEDSTIAAYNDIGGNSSRIYAVGTEGTIRRRLGDVWFEMHLDWPTGIVADLHAVSMTETEGFISGTGGSIQHFDGTSWEPMKTNSGETLWDVIALEGARWRAVAVGSVGTILGLDSATGEWSVMPAPVTAPLYAIARGPGGMLYVVGAYGTFLRYSDNQWQRMALDTSTHFFGACMQDGALFVSGGDIAFGGKLFRYGPSNP